jgi:hypothetical protein
MILWKTVNGPRPYGTTTREINYYRGLERQLRMGKSIDEMSDAELISAISELQAVRVPSSKPKQPKRLDEKRPPKDPAKKTWRDDLFGDG